MSGNPRRLPVQDRRRFLVRHASALAVLATGATACSTPGATLPPLPPSAAEPYRLGPGDRVRVTVFDDPQLSGDFRVSDAGAISLPLAGSVPATGRTTREVERAIEGILKEKGLFQQPSVAVEVMEYRSVYVLGMVERGGQAPYQPGMTVLSAIAVFGGFNYRAVRDHVSLTRIGEDGVAREYRAGPQALVRPGDVINVLERWF
ncbi:polysaccharide export protein [Roseococcus sp. MDT2-1-1]|uniref:Polysaccharide export protein n=1 Tax=Sabulicella glaciei TaxID=2984948 RepID=A0ABT3P105_9PROT|nr:polysaccharide biosynthesis/export family protein [Roseococcus sp. MDT2-1-1]MCW8088087.1 polysaccharide export protein [Roseococcus sp. MDT2-1-1]